MALSAVSTACISLILLCWSLFHWRCLGQCNDDVWMQIWYFCATTCAFVCARLLFYEAVETTARCRLADRLLEEGLMVTFQRKPLQHSLTLKFTVACLVISLIGLVFNQHASWRQYESFLVPFLTQIVAVFLLIVKLGDHDSRHMSVNHIMLHAAFDETDRSGFAFFHSRSHSSERRGPQEGGYRLRSQAEDALLGLLWGLGARVPVSFDSLASELKQGSLEYPAVFATQSFFARNGLRAGFASALFRAGEFTEPEDARFSARFRQLLLCLRCALFFSFMLVSLFPSLVSLTQTSDDE
eukprot:CAMPEP_0175918742 /NCGR_PEP_ID=MMETSP0108-20121206/12038_1 /TAXON_ID=195067 ORGANISM="Goniomonas pacifica, Strain CCMP1869" /NCGR_SAMPLE_ID=MMETSP0108 /ASSEMBLY_ACC=CAM_ASM_000204 /LENGTH=297 /DNA_ID=CAMNT_0017241373 /DNA_START=4 /DNA_END=898 /DNA_ORIENTATION=+